MVSKLTIFCILVAVTATGADHHHYKARANTELKQCYMKCSAPDGSTVTSTVKPISTTTQQSSGPTSNTQGSTEGSTGGSSAITTEGQSSSTSTTTTDSSSQGPSSTSSTTQSSVDPTSPTPSNLPSCPCQCVDSSGNVHTGGASISDRHHHENKKYSHEANRHHEGQHQMREHHQH